MARRWLLALFLTAIATDICFAQNIPSGMLKTDTMRPLPKVAATELQLKSFDRPTERPEVAYAFMSNKTRLVASPGTPLQVV